MKNILSWCTLFIIIIYSGVLFSQTKEWEIVKSEKMSEKIIKIYNEKRLEINKSLPDGANQLQEIPEDAPIRVVARLESSSYKIIRISAGELIWALDDPIRKKILDDKLIDEISKKNYFWSSKIELSTTKVDYIDDTRTRDIYWWTPSKFELDASGQTELRITDKWAFEFKLGNEEFGLPGLTSGTARISLNNNSLKLIAQIPLGLVKNNTGLWGRNVLASSFGGGIIAEMNHWGGLVMFSDLRSKKYADQFRDDFLVLSMPFQSLIYYAFTQNIPGTKIALRIKVGASYSQIQKDIVENPGKSESPLKKMETIFYPDAYFRIEYLTMDMNMELFGQFSSVSLLVGAAYNFTEYFGISAKFGVLELGIREERQNLDKTFFTISPRIRL